MDGKFSELTSDTFDDRIGGRTDRDKNFRI